MKRKIIITGKLPPPYMGPSVAFQILINSRLRDYYELLWYNVQANKTLNTLGKWSLEKVISNIKLYLNFRVKLKIEKPELAIIPISQSTAGFIKDSFFILMCKMSGVKVLIQLRGSNFRNWLSGSSSLTRWYVRYVLKGTKGVLVLGEKLRYLFEDFYPMENIYVVPNGANIFIEDFNPSRGNVPRIIYLGNLQRSKGIEDVIEAIGKLNQKMPGSFQAVVAGAWREPEVKEHCETVVNRQHIPVTFAGPVSGDEKFRLLASSDIFVFTPREPEGHPWTIVEAMAMSLPVIATDRGAITESIRDGINGFIVNGNSPDEICTRLETLIRDPELRSKMGAKNLTDYLEKYTEDKMVENYIRVIDHVLDTP